MQKINFLLTNLVSKINISVIISNLLCFISFSFGFILPQSCNETDKSSLRLQLNTIATTSLKYIYQKN